MEEKDATIVIPATVYLVVMGKYSINTCEVFADYQAQTQSSVRKYRATFNWI
jgi:hypothetical protein